MKGDAWTVADPCACPVCGRDSCEDHLPQEHQERQRLAAVRALDLIHTPRPAEIIEGIAFAGCVSVLVSESGTGKTFVLTDAAGAVSDDVSWHGRRVRAGSVLYLGYEGDALGVRLRAARDVAGRRLEHVYVLRASDPLSPRVTREGEERSIGEIAVGAAIETLAAEIETSGRPPIVLNIIDTVRASLSGSEDSSEHVAAYLRAVRRVTALLPHAATILAHHAGWQDGEHQRKRERGSSAWRGNSDVTLYLEAGEYDADRGEAQLTLRALKVRDGEKPPPLHLIRRRVELAELAGPDIRCGAVTSCIIEPDRRTREDREAQERATTDAKHQAMDLRTLRAISDNQHIATSQEKVRMLLNARKADVSESIVRLIQNGWLLQGPQRQPYLVTAAGLIALNGGLETSSSQ